MLNKNEQEHSGLTDLDEILLFMTRPYMVFVLLCWFLSLYCIISLRNDTRAMAFALSVITFIIDSIFLVILYYKAKYVRYKNKCNKKTTKR